MIKEGQDAGNPVTPPASTTGPTSSSADASTNSLNLSTSTPAQSTANNVPSTPEQLVNHWVQEKENYYRGRVDKYPQYANWTVSPEARRGMMRQAEDIFRNHPGDVKKYMGRSGAFNYANIANDQYIAEANAPAREARRQAEEARKVQQQPMQNPTASTAIANPTTYAPTSEREIINQGIPIIEREFRAGYSPDSTSPQARAFRQRVRTQLGAIMPNVPEEQRYWRFMEMMRNNGIQGFGNDFLNNAMTQMYKSYYDANFGNQYQNLSPNDQNTVLGNSLLNQDMLNPDGTYKTWRDIDNPVNISGLDGSNSILS